MAFKRKCKLCEVGWPDTDDYEQCPQCMELTKIERGTPTHAPGDAEALRREAVFGWWLLVNGRL